MKKIYKVNSSHARLSFALAPILILFSAFIVALLSLEKHTDFKMTNDYQTVQITLCCLIAAIPLSILNGFIQEKINQKNSIKLKSLLLQLKERKQPCQVEQLESFHPDIRSKKNDTWLFWQENVCYLAGEKGCIKLGKESWLKIINKQQKISEIYIKEIEK